jgi:hypothetical protein
VRRVQCTCTYESAYHQISRSTGLFAVLLALSASNTGVRLRNINCRCTDHKIKVRRMKNAYFNILRIRREVHNNYVRDCQDVYLTQI